MPIRSVGGELIPRSSAYSAPNKTKRNNKKTRKRSQGKITPDQARCVVDMQIANKLKKMFAE